MEEELSQTEENNPLTHNLEAVLPGVHSRLAAQTNEVTALWQEFSRLERAIATHFHTIATLCDAQNGGIHDCQWHELQPMYICSTSNGTA